MVLVVVQKIRNVDLQEFRLDKIYECIRVMYGYTYDKDIAFEIQNYLN